MTRVALPPVVGMRAAAYARRPAQVNAALREMQASDSSAALPSKPKAKRTKRKAKGKAKAKAKAARVSKDEV